MAVVVFLPAPAKQCELVDMLPRDVADGEAHLVEAWPGSVTIECSTEPDMKDIMHGWILDITGDFPDRVVGFLFRIPPHEAAARRAAQKGARHA